MLRIMPHPVFVSTAHTSIFRMDSNSTSYDLLLPLNPTPYTLHLTPDTPHPTPYTPHPEPYTLHPTPYTLHPTPYTPHPTPYTPHPTPYTPHPDLYILHPTTYTLYPSPYALYPTPHTLHPTPYTPNPTNQAPYPDSLGQMHILYGYSLGHDSLNAYLDSQRTKQVAAPAAKAWIGVFSAAVPGCLSDEKGLYVDGRRGWRSN